MGSYTDSYRARYQKGGSSSSTDSDASDRSKSTAPTVYSARWASKPIQVPHSFHHGDVRDSVSTYASTIPSADDLPEVPRYEVEDRTPEAFPAEALPSNSTVFADLFPSSRRLLIRHDDATIDGNMNLRVDTTASHRGGYQRDVTLFHLRMYDLYSRKFSFRRYCRDSGREVCHSVRKPRSSLQEKRPMFRRSWSSVLASLRPGSSNGHGVTPHSEPKSHEAVSKSARDDEFWRLDEENLDSPLEGGMERERAPVLGDTTLLEFSNYAHVEVKHRGTGSSKRYEFEYWSTKYQWRRESRWDGDLHEISYHLVNIQTSKTIAHIMPQILTPLEAVEEESKGGWVSPSSMWISDPSVYDKMHDIADVIVATGLIVLVDDCIRRRWHPKRQIPLMQPLSSSLSRGIEFMGPKRLIDEMLHWRRTP
ncbi:hypothetical protein ASPZODRAFT_142204 [Penicilliopsis zonata CBS 506.65]|uniref:Uncharacterized protein n=1 Tax=Penicilliopsis zonata CBS 506.65 TaxID=1073090 RepID=A0A1L9SH40_9EURO|nr:hypothetical protein ASPZODRAFT_142204 [Penicilliopsis zonata CBS 506.65]OJJ46384.1 hypothetical protein ASPZODRAFT_142204 [Penicilliopsis zonata CBS 506.65]